MSLQSLQKSSQRRPELSVILFSDSGREHLCLASPVQRAGAMRSPSGTLSVLCHFDCSLCKSFLCIAYVFRGVFSPYVRNCLEEEHFSRVTATFLKPSKYVSYQKECLCLTNPPVLHGVPHASATPGRAQPSW